MTNKEVVAEYMQGFRETDHARILTCLTDDVEWYMPGYFHHKGIDAFDKEIENDAFTGSPAITIFRMTEEGDVIIAEGAVQCIMKSGFVLDALFCDVFEMRGGRISKLITYQINKVPAA